MKKMPGNMRIGSALLFAALFFTGCEYFERGHSQNDPEKPEDRFQFLHKEDSAAQTPRNESGESDEVSVKKQDQSGVSDSEIAALAKPSAADNVKKAPQAQTGGTPAAFYEDFILFDADEKVSVSLVFNSAPMIDVIPAFADVLGFNFVADPDLKGTVTLNINSEMTRRELWNAFEKMLFLSGASARVDGSLLRLVPVSKLAQQPDLAITGKPENREVLYYALKNTTAKDVVTQIKPFLGKDAAISELTRPNAIILSDTTSNIAKLRQILELVDGSGRTAWPRLIVKCENILPSKIVAELKEVFPVLGFYVQQTVNDKTEQPGSVQLTAIDRLQLVIGSAATEEAVTEIRNWIKTLDSAQSLDQERVFVYKVMHGKADQLLTGLSVIYNTTGQSLTIDSDTGNVRTNTVNSQQTTRTRTTTNTNSTRTGTNANTVNTETDQSSSLFENPVRIFSDGELNRLVIRTTPRTYASIKALLDRLDVVPAQVLLQVLVVEVSLDKSTEFGLELSAQGSVNGNVIGGGSGNYSNLNPFITDVIKDSAGNVTGRNYTPNAEGGAHGIIYDPDNPSQKFAYIKALAKNGNLKVISSPQVLVSSHNKADIWVGQKVPYVANAITDTASSSAASTTLNTSVSFEETGIRLTITPEVTSTDFISLDVYQELSSVDTENKYTNVDAPVFSKRTVETNMTIQNGKTMVIGGLIQETKHDNLESIPIINEIPFLRRLFGSTSASANRSEILILITGTIVSEKNEVEDMIRKYNDALKALNKFDRALGDGPDAEKKLTIFDNRDELQ